MARFWVGGSASWDATAGSKWALTSGGAGGQAVPTAADDVFFDAASGAVTVTVSGSRVAKSVTCTGFTGTLTGTATPILTLSGDCVLVSGMTFNPTSGPALVFDAVANLTSAGKTLRAVTVNGASAALTLQDNLNCGTSMLTLTAGSFDANDFDIDCGSFNAQNSNTKTLSMGNGTWRLSATSGNVWSLTSTGTTFNKEGATIAFTGTTGNKGFASGGFTYNVFSVAAQVGTGGINFNLGTRFSNINLAGQCIINITGTLILDNVPTTWSGASLAAAVQIMGIAIGTQSTLSVPSGAVSLANTFIRDMNFTGGASFAATNSYDLRGNSGITITPPSGGGGAGIARLAGGGLVH